MTARQRVEEAAAHLVAETTGRVEAWVDGQLGDDEEA